MTCHVTDKIINIIFFFYFYFIIEKIYFIFNDIVIEYYVVAICRVFDSNVV
jgi:hypothetical protein